MSSRDDAYHAIGQMLADATHGQWERAEVRAKIGEDWSELKAAQYGPAGQRTSIRIADPGEMTNQVRAVRRVTRKVSDAGGDEWTSLVFSLWPDGRFHVEFGYE